MQSRGVLDKMAIVSAVARPCDFHPEFSSGPKDNLYSIISKSYVAQRQEKDGMPGYRMAHDRITTDIAEGDMGGQMPEGLLHEIDRLYGLGYRHIFFVAKRYHDRKIGRAEPLQRHFDNPASIRALLSRYGDLNIYPVVSDKYGAVRLRNKNVAEDLLENASLYQEHHFSIDPQLRGVLKMTYQPLYSACTLQIVGNKAKAETKRPQSGITTYFLLADPEGDFSASVKAGHNLLHGEPREDLIGFLRAIHYLESQKGPLRADRSSNACRMVPTLDSLSWMSPSSVQEAGDMLFAFRRRGHRRAYIHLPAFLHKVVRVVDRLDADEAYWADKHGSDDEADNEE